MEDFLSRDFLAPSLDCLRGAKNGDVNGAVAAK